MAYSAAEGPFWAGGSAQGWFVNLHKEPEAYPGVSSEVRVRWFDSRDFATRELGASLAAEALVVDLNASMMGAGIVPALKRAELALVYAADCMGNCGKTHEDGIQNVAADREKIAATLKLALTGA